MKILIDNSKLKKQLSDVRVLQRSFGNLADNIYMRIAYLEAAETLADVSHLPPINRHGLEGNYKGCFAISVNKKFRIIFKPITDSEQIVSLKDVKEISIIAIEDYH